MPQYCSLGDQAQIFVNGQSIGTFSAPVETELTQLNYWDYVFSGQVSSSGCKTGYTVIYRESVNVTPSLIVASRSGQGGSCNLAVKDVRASVTFDSGQTYKPIGANPSALSPPDSNNSSHYYPNGNFSINWHGGTEQAALPTLYSKTAKTFYSLKVYSGGSIVFEKNDYTSSPTVSVDCINVSYDCINGGCIPKATYNTPGFYASLTDCQANCGGSRCTGKCLTNAEWAQIQGLAIQIKNKSCS